MGHSFLSVIIISQMNGKCKPQAHMETGVKGRFRMKYGTCMYTLLWRKGFGIYPV